MTVDTLSSAISDKHFECQALKELTHKECTTLLQFSIARSLGPSARLSIAILLALFSTQLRAAEATSFVADNHPDSLAYDTCSLLRLRVVDENGQPFVLPTPMSIKIRTSGGLMSDSATGTAGPNGDACNWRSEQVIPADQSWYEFYGRSNFANPSGNIRFHVETAEDEAEYSIGKVDDVFDIPFNPVAQPLDDYYEDPNGNGGGNNSGNGTSFGYSSAQTLCGVEYEATGSIRLTTCGSWVSAAGCPNSDGLAWSGADSLGHGKSMHATAMAAVLSGNSVHLATSGCLNGYDQLMGIRIVQ